MIWSFAGEDFTGEPSLVVSWTSSFELVKRVLVGFLAGDLSIWLVKEVPLEPREEERDWFSS